MYSSPKRTPIPPPMITASGSSRLIEDASPSPSAFVARLHQVLGDAVAVLQGPLPDAAREPVAAALLHDLEQLRLLALLLESPGLGLHRAPARVGLHATRVAGAALGPAAADDHVADLARGAAAQPRLAAEDQPAADAGAPERPQHRSCRACRHRAGTPRPPPLARRCRPSPACPGRPRASRLAGRSPSQPGRLRAFETTPVSSFASPGEPTPTPASDFVSTPACSAASRRAPAIAAATSFGPPLVGVGTRASPRTLLRALTTTVWILVPPRSMPPLAEAGFAGLTRETISLAPAPSKVGLGRDPEHGPVGRRCDPDGSLPDRDRLRLLAGL